MKTFLFSILIFIFSIIITKEKENETEVVKKTKILEEQEKTSKKVNESEKVSQSKTENKKKNKTTKNQKSKKKDKNKDKGKGKDNKGKLVPPPQLPFRSEIPIDPFNLPNDKVFLLNDKTLDKALQNGNNYRWLVILFSETCGHCYFARTEIRKILSEYEHSSSLRFAEIEINFNPLANMRFNIEGVPYIFMLQNNTMYLFDSYPVKKNIIKFLETPLSYFLPEEKRPFPLKLNVGQKGWEGLKNTLEEITNSLNSYLAEKGINFKFSPLLLVIIALSLGIFGLVIDLFCCSKFCPDYEEKEEKEKKDGKEIQKQNIGKKEVKEVKEDKKEKEEKKDKELSEDEKIKREKEKEKEREKENNLTENNKKQDYLEKKGNKNLEEKKFKTKKKKE